MPASKQDTYIYIWNKTSEGCIKMKTSHGHVDIIAAKAHIKMIKILMELGSFVLFTSSY